MITTFHLIHIILGLWLALANYTTILQSTTLAWNNLIIGLLIAGYNIYYLFVRKDVDLKS